jgi:hypothetical protein
MTGPQKNPQETKSQSLNALRVQFKNWWFSTLRSDSVRAAKVWVVLAAISLLLIFGGHKVGRFGLLVGFLLALAMTRSSISMPTSASRVSSPGKNLKAKIRGAFAGKRSNSRGRSG